MKRDFWINQLLFQLSWPACVFGAAAGNTIPAFVLVGGFALWQLQPRRRHPDDLMTLLSFLATGIVLDSVWLNSGLLAYASAGPVPGWTPGWLMLLWVALALSVHHSLGVFRKHWVLWILLASVASPFSYTMAERVGAVDWLAPSWVVVLCVGPLWGAIVGLQFFLSGRRAAHLQQVSESIGVVKQ